MVCFPFEGGLKDSMKVEFLLSNRGGRTVSVSSFSSYLTCSLFYHPFLSYFQNCFQGFFLHAPLNLMNALLMIQQFIQQRQFSASSITGTPTVIKDEMSVTVAAKTKLWLSLIDLSRCGQDRENMQFAHRNLSNQSNPGAKRITHSHWHPSPRATATPAF